MANIASILQSVEDLLKKSNQSNEIRLK